MLSLLLLLMMIMMMMMMTMINVSYLHGRVSAILHHRSYDMSSLGFIVDIFCFVQFPLGINPEAPVVVIG